MICRLPLIFLQQSRCLACLDSVEADVERLGLAVDDGKLGPDWLPCKRMNVFLDLDTVDRNLLLSHVKHFKVEVQASILDLLLFTTHLAVAVNLNAKVVASLLPVHLAVCHVEQVLDSDLVSWWDFEQGNSSGNIFVLGDPISWNILQFLMFLIESLKQKVS